MSSVGGIFHRRFLPPSHRAVTKNRLVAYITSMQNKMVAMSKEAQMMGKMGERWFQQEMAKLEEVSETLRSVEGVSSVL